MDYINVPDATATLPGREDSSNGWWRAAVDEWSRTHALGRRSAWLPMGFDPYSVCNGLGPTGSACRDPWCSEPGVYASGHDRRKALQSPQEGDGSPENGKAVA